MQEVYNSQFLKQNDVLFGIQFHSTIPIAKVLCVHLLGLPLQ